MSGHRKDWVSERLDEWTCAQELGARVFAQAFVHQHQHTVFSLQRQHQHQPDFETGVNA